MFFGMMMGAQRVMIMVSMTAVARVREHNVLVLVIAIQFPQHSVFVRFRVFLQRPHRFFWTAFLSFLFFLTIDSFFVNSYIMAASISSRHNPGLLMAAAYLLIASPECVLFIDS